MSCRNPPSKPCPHLTSHPPPVARRTILQGGVAGALVLAVPACGMSPEATPAGPMPAGNVSAIAADSLQMVSGANAFIGRDTGGLYAMSAVCTHAGCLLGTGGTPELGIACGCHGSRFDGNGAVIHGPAGRPLQHYRVDVADDGSITIQGGIPVDATARTAV